MYSQVWIVKWRANNAEVDFMVSFKLKEKKYLTF
jgi:hypothetical protein